MLKQFLCIFFLSAIVFSLNVTYDSSIDSTGSVVSLIRYSLNSTDSKIHSFSVFGEIQNLEAFDGSGSPLPVSSSFSDGWSTLSLSIPFNYAELSFTTNSQSFKNSTLWSYSSKTKFSENLSSFSSSLILPLGSRLISTNGEVSTKDSKIIIYWNTLNVSDSSIINLKESHEIDSHAASENDYSLIAFGGLALILIIGLGLYFSKKSSSTSDQKSIPNSSSLDASSISEVSSTQKSSFENLEKNSVYLTLDEIDKQIVREIYIRGGSTTQAQINLNTHLPKATLSRRLASLESRGIIQKSQKGIRNLVSLTDLVK